VTEPHVPPPRTIEPTPAVEHDGRFSINEDWAATLFGLVLLLLVLSGVITGSFVKGLLP
jgi:hypothetical protein